MFSPIFCTNFFQQFFPVWAVEKENKLLIGPKTDYFSKFASWKSNHNKYYIIFREKICRLGIQDQLSDEPINRIEVVSLFCKPETL